MAKKIDCTDYEELSRDECEAQQVIELPARELLTLIDPGLVGSVSGTMPGTAPTTDPSQLAGQSTTGASNLMNQMNQAASAAAAAHQPSTYQQSVNSFAQS